ncbi:beta-ketoacyl synthase chain length factor [Acinetobacter puyangensis]|uniref:Beta-ketoacyl synthase, N-terminal domain n=1 Tax=Acinetobacter puyangensis TaxID=1096779 RepID=A0A240E372_9GAMM|nr:beta-ketoacyl synthase chain length factor [Acinetobacter puyangensis]SNX43234.1 Beta-ketoacyl synthase, N-terminal domain [Acinetobacter puyangensis]
MYKCRISHLQFFSDYRDLKTLEHIPAIQRRRLSSLAKLALHAARSCLLSLDTSVDYIVWSSRYGDEKKTVSILNDIAESQAISPTQFSTSVHNAIAGLYSILFQDDTPSVSLSSHASYVWQDCVLDAYAFLTSQQKQQVLVVYYDESLPEIYQDSLVVAQPIAMAAIISLAHPNVDIQPINETMIENSLQIEAFRQFWHSDQMVWQSNSWVWKKC